MIQRKPPYRWTLLLNSVIKIKIKISKIHMHLIPHTYTNL